MARGKAGGSAGKSRRSGGSGKASGNAAAGAEARRGAGSDKLTEYERKRDFAKTSEPRGARTSKSRAGKSRGQAARRASEPIFVVQKHDARRLHYDFRIEAGGALVSWAVPKGPSLDPHERRLAQPTEDHPMDYADFEGVIAEGEYGAGAVIVWDRGVYRNITEKHGKPVPVEKALADGHVSLVLAGDKLRGGFALTRFRGDGDADASWLLVKADDEYADRYADVLADASKSVLTGKTIEQVADEGDDDT
jgi:DNA ligase D-like protein (predicted 3'-phosphoesterase)